MRDGLARQGDHQHQGGATESGIPILLYSRSSDTRDCLVGPTYFVISGLRGGALGVGGAGEITNVTRVIQALGWFSAANSLSPFRLS